MEPRISVQDDMTAATAGSSSQIGGTKRKSRTSPSPAVLTVKDDVLSGLDGVDALTSLWFLFTKCKTGMDDGHRLENISWRLWSVGESQQVGKRILNSVLNNPPLILNKVPPSSLSPPRPIVNVIHPTPNPTPPETPAMRGTNTSTSNTLQRPKLSPSSPTMSSDTSVTSLLSVCGCASDSSFTTASSRGAQIKEDEGTVKPNGIPHPNNDDELGLPERSTRSTGGIKSYSTSNRTTSSSSPSRSRSRERASSSSSGRKRRRGVLGMTSIHSHLTKEKVQFDIGSHGSGSNSGSTMSRSTEDSRSRSPPRVPSNGNLATRKPSAGRGLMTMTPAAQALPPQSSHLLPPPATKQLTLSCIADNLGLNNNSNNLTNTNQNNHKEEMRNQLEALFNVRRGPSRVQTTTHLQPPVAQHQQQMQLQLQMQMQQANQNQNQTRLAPPPPPPPTTTLAPPPQTNVQAQPSQSQGQQRLILTTSESDSEEDEDEWTDMFKKLPSRSYSGNLNQNGPRRPGLLSQLMNPDPRIFPTSISALTSDSHQDDEELSDNVSPIRISWRSSPQQGRSPSFPSEGQWNGLYTLGSANCSDTSLLSSAASIDSTLSSEQSSIYSEIPEPNDKYNGVDLTGIVRKLDTYPFECGAVADLYRGELQSNLSTVAIKIFRRAHTDHKSLAQTSERLYQEASVWSTLTHRNILPFLGICRDVGPSVALITPLCSRGHIMRYLQTCPKAPREKLEIILGIASGMVYLHSKGIIHGNFSTSKVLMNDDEVPVVCAYGTSTLSRDSGNPISMALSPIRYTAPECFALNNHATAAKTESSDVYSFAMVVLEIFSDLQPYHDIVSEPAVLFHIVQGGRPKREDFDPLLFNEHLWSLLTQLWNQLPAFRPDMSAVLRRLNALYASNGLEPGHATVPINSSAGKQSSKQNITTHIENLTRDSSLSSSSGEETSYADLTARKNEAKDLNGCVSQDDQYPFAAGGNSNIYKGKVSQPDGRKIRVAIKMIRVSDDGSGQMEDVVRRLRREAAIWSILSHRNLLPFMDFSMESVVQTSE